MKDHHLGERIFWAPFPAPFHSWPFPLLQSPTSNSSSLCYIALGIRTGDHLKHWYWRSHLWSRYYKVFLVSLFYSFCFTHVSMKGKVCIEIRYFDLWYSEFRFAVEWGSETMTVFTQQFVPLSSHSATECSNPEVPYGSVMSEQQIFINR